MLLNIMLVTEYHVSYAELITLKYLSDLTLCASKSFCNVSLLPFCPDLYVVATMSAVQKNCSAENIKFWELFFKWTTKSELQQEC